MEAMDAAEVGRLTEWRLVVATFVLAGLLALESVAPLFAGRRRRLAHVGVNLALAGLNALVAAAFAFALLAVTEGARAQGFGLLRLVEAPVWAQWVGAILAVDCWQYWWHRLNHRVPLLWRFHAVHHADAEMDASTGVRFHTGEMVLSFAARLVVLPLLGVTVPQVLLYEAIALPVILFHHANVRLPGGVDRALRWLIVTPWMHVVHHSRRRPETDSNFTSLFSVWDRVFGSFRLRADPAGVEIGLDGYEEREWRGLPGLLAAPFRRRGTEGGEQPRRNGGRRAG